ncbi:hypothetical protein GCM10027589_32540 [Actinocorallia lasiicapitis]
MASVIGVIIAVFTGVTLLGQGTGAIRLIPDSEAGAPRPAVRPVPPETPTALAALGPFGDGADGIRMPAAKAEGGLTAKEAAQGYELAKKLLTAAHLDPAVLYDGATEPYAVLLAEHQRKRFRDGVAKKAEANTRDEVTAFEPGTVQRPEPIRVRGRAEPTATTVNGADGKPHTGILLKIDFEFVYPLDTTEVSDQRTAELFITKTGAKVEVWTGRWQGVVRGATCETEDGFLHPDTPDALCARPAA